MVAATVTAATMGLAGVAAAPAGAVPAPVTTNPFIPVVAGLCAADGGGPLLIEKSGGFVCDTSGRLTLPAIQAGAICTLVLHGQFVRVVGQGWGCNVGTTT